ncbi:MAG: cytochrome c biogenesis protein CcsA [Polaromonas sp.]|nr:cytochrome c biogenesis protein CcsA [Polaromonas sp.]
MDDSITGDIKQQSLRRSYGFYSTSAIVYWIGFLTIAIAIALGMAYLEAEKLSPSFAQDKLFSQHLISFANLLLIGSTFLYISHLWITAKIVGPLASGMATLGAMGVMVALLVSWFETSHIHRIRPAPFSSLNDVIALFSAVTVGIYLMLERVYHTRAAGAFIMPIVAGAMLFESVLLSVDHGGTGHLASVLKNYWIHAHVLSNFFGYGAFAVAALLGTMYLFKERAEQRCMTQGFAIRSLPDLQGIDRLMFEAIALGFSTFTLGTLLGMAWSYQESGKFFSWSQQEVGALAVWLIYLGYFYGHHKHRWRGSWMAWLAISGFGVSVLCFAGMNLFLTGRHI